MKSKKQPKNKLYIVRKFINAPTLQEAIALEKKTPLDEIWLDEDWRKAQGFFPDNGPVGFK